MKPNLPFRQHLLLFLLLLTALLLSGCALGMTPVPTITLTVTQTSTATPDIYATSAQRTLEAIASAPPVTATAAETPPPEGTLTVSPAGDGADLTRTPTATPTLTFTPTLTLTPSPTLSGSETPRPTPGVRVLLRSFSVSPTSISPGESITLTWEADGDRATLYRLSDAGTLATAETVDLTGTRIVETDAAASGELRYLLVVGQDELEESALVVVQVGCNREWFTPGLEGCPTIDPLTTTAAAEPFERGWMFWLEALDRIYVLYDDDEQPAYQVFADPWEPGLPEFDPSLTPPDGYYQPVRGFGMVWRGEGEEGDPRVRERLGWALEQEAGFTAVFQCTSDGQGETCYLRGTTGGIIRLAAGGESWTLVQGSEP